MSLYADKYRPTKLSHLDYHIDQANDLKKLVEAGDFPHLLFYGPSGSGKTTRIHCLLHQLYGSGTDKRRLEQVQFSADSGGSGGAKKHIETTVVNSNFHLEWSASGGGSASEHRLVVQHLIKTVAETQQLDIGQQRAFKSIIIMEADLLSRDAQHALRRTLEKFMASCRVILCATSTSKIIPAIRSRCLGIRVAAPTQSEIEFILKNVARKEELNLPDAFAQRIAKSCDGDLRVALMTLETAKVEAYPFDLNKPLVTPDWLQYCSRIGQMIIQEQSPRRILEVRNLLYEILVHLIPPEDVFKAILDVILPACGANLQIQVISLAAHYEHNLQLGDKPIFHLEAFVVKFMCLFNDYLNETCSGITEEMMAE